MKRILIKSNIIILLCTLASCTIFKNKNPKELNFLKSESHRIYVINIFSEIRLKENGDIYLKASPDMHKTVKFYTDESDKESKPVVPNDSYEVHKENVFKAYTITDGPHARGDYKTYIIKRKKDRCKYRFIYERVRYSKGRVFNNIKNNTVGSVYFDEDGNAICYTKKVTAKKNIWTRNYWKKAKDENIVLKIPE